MENYLNNIHQFSCLIMIRSVILFHQKEKKREKKKLKTCQPDKMSKVEVGATGGEEWLLPHSTNSASRG